MNQSPYLHGPQTSDKSTEFRVWAPNAQKVDLLIENFAGETLQTHPMMETHLGYFSLPLPTPTGTLYRFKLETEGGSIIRPDPASHFQPNGVHHASQVVSHDFEWTDLDWKGIDAKDIVAYELHIGTFGPNSNFSDIIESLDQLLELGINTIELMPVAQFPGERNWGYDGVYPYAVQNSYGGPDGLKQLVNACHNKNIAVFLDVVYNHMGPEGNYLRDFGPYFTDRYHTPWGAAINYDDANCDMVRSFFAQNALFWVKEYHIDGLRLDAVHAIFDQSAYHILEQISDTIHNYAIASGRKIFVVAESDLNDPRLIKSKEQGGYNLDAHWCDDFHHSLHTLLTGENKGYYQDFGKLEDLEKCFNNGYVYAGDYSVYRHRRHGRPLENLRGEQLWVYSQNHDQIGNRFEGERLHHLVSQEAHLLAATLVLLSPYTPMLFMGEEYAEKAPFQYFIHHGDSELVNAVREGRKREFKDFDWSQHPDPQSEDVLRMCQLNLDLKHISPHSLVYQHYRQLIEIRKQYLNTGLIDKGHARARILENGAFLVHYQSNTEELKIFCNIGQRSLSFFESAPSQSIIYTNLADASIGMHDHRFTLPAFGVAVIHNLAEHIKE